MNRPPVLNSVVGSALLVAVRAEQRLGPALLMAVRAEQRLGPALLSCLPAA